MQNKIPCALSLLPPAEFIVPCSFMSRILGCHHLTYHVLSKGVSFSSASFRFKGLEGTGGGFLSVSSSQHGPCHPMGSQRMSAHL